MPALQRLVLSSLAVFALLGGTEAAATHSTSARKDSLSLSTPLSCRLDSGRYRARVRNTTDQTIRAGDTVRVTFVVVTPGPRNYGTPSRRTNVLRVDHDVRPGEMFDVVQPRGAISCVASVTLY